LGDIAGITLVPLLYLKEVYLLWGTIEITRMIRGSGDRLIRGVSLGNR
jgi:hypothetical protein